MATIPRRTFISVLPHGDGVYLEPPCFAHLLIGQASANGGLLVRSNDFCFIAKCQGGESPQLFQQRCLDFVGGFPQRLVMRSFCFQRAVEVYNLPCKVTLAYCGHIDCLIMFWARCARGRWVFREWSAGEFSMVGHRWHFYVNGITCRPCGETGRRLVATGLLHEDRDEVFRHDVTGREFALPVCP